MVLNIFWLDFGSLEFELKKIRPNLLKLQQVRSKKCLVESCFGKDQDAAGCGVKLSKSKSFNFFSALWLDVQNCAPKVRSC